MATIEDRWHKVVDGERVQTSRYGRGLRWRVRYRDPVGDERSQAFGSKADADRFRAHVETSISDATYLDPNRGRATVGELAERWLAIKTSTRKRRTVESYSEVYRSLVAPEWGRVPLSRVEYAGVQEWISDLSSRMSPARVRHAHYVLRSVLELAVKDRRIVANPAKGVELPQARKEKDHVYLSHGQLEALADACGRYRPFVLLLGYTGLRWGEAIALRPRDVDQLRQRIRVERTIAEHSGALWVDTPKTHKARWVPVAEPAWSALLAELEGIASESEIFTAPNGGTLRSSNFRRSVFDPAASSIGLDGLTPHDLRHTAASIAIAAGCSVLGVQRMLGHAKASMTLDVYAGLFDDDMDEVARRMGEAAAAAPKWEPPRSIRRA